MNNFLFSFLPLFQLWWTVLPITFLWMTLMYLLALWRKDNSLADIGWGLGFIVLTIFLAGQTHNWRNLPLLTTVGIFLVCLWGARLALHILWRHWGKPEDWRYANWRKNWGKTAWWKSYLQVFLLQGLFLIVVASPALWLAAQQQDVPWNWGHLLGLTVWSFGFFWETVGDWQLQVFKNSSRNKGKILTTGLWKYSRHPNYFGEVTLWWGLWIMAANTLGGWVTFLGPLTISITILGISGVPLLEAKYKDRPDFKKYAAKTSVFIPWFPGK